MGQILNIKLKILYFAKFVWYAICHIHDMADIEIFQNMLSCSMVGVSQENCVFYYLVWVVLHIILAIMIRKWQSNKFLGRNQVPALKSSNMWTHKESIVFFKGAMTILQQIHFSENPVLFQIRQEYKCIYKAWVFGIQINLFVLWSHHKNIESSFILKFVYFFVIDQIEFDQALIVKDVAEIWEAGDKIWRQR